MNNASLFWISPDLITNDQVSPLRETVLDGSEQARCDELKWEGRHREFVIGRSVARFGFAKLFGNDARHWEMRKTETGKPVLVAGQCDDLHFNIAHTQGCVLCCFSTGRRIGVDVEPRSHATTIEKVKERVFSPYELAEIDHLSGSSRQERLLHLWTGKEAYTKARGEGLGLDFRQFSLRFAGGEPTLLFDGDMQDEPKDWGFETHWLNDAHLVTIAQHWQRTSKTSANLQSISPNDLLQFAAA